jgi:ankyrin repeat protein
MRGRLLAVAVLALLAGCGGERGAQRTLIDKGWLTGPVEQKRDAAGKLVGNASDFSRNACSGAGGEAARLFIEAGFSPNGSGDGSLLLATVKRECLDAMRILLDAGADPNVLYRGHPGVILISTAIAENREGLKLLIARGARLDPGPRRQMAAALLKAESNEVEHWAKPVEDTIAFLEELKVDLLEADENGDTLLHVAVREENAAAVTALLARGADVAVPNKAGDIPWLQAADYFLSETACRRMKDTVATPWRDPNPKRDARLRDALLEMLSRVKDFEQRDPRGRTLAFYLVRDLPLLREYLAKGLAFDVADNRFLTPWDLMPPQDVADFATQHPELTRVKAPGARSLLHVAASFPVVHWRLVDRLIAAGLPVNAVDGFGDTPLLAFFHGQPLKNNRGRPPPIWGCTDDRFAKHEPSSVTTPPGSPPSIGDYMLERLLLAGADPNRAATDGDIPMMFAAWPNTAALLLAHGADPRASVNGKPIVEHFAERAARGNSGAAQIRDLIVKAQQAKGPKPRAVSAK